MSATVPRRRILVAAVAGIACLPGAGLAQSKQRVYRVGVITSAWPDKTVVDELSRRGYTEGVNLVFEVRLLRSAEASEADRAAGELLRAKVDLILAYGETSALAAKNATSTLPIVLVSVPDPVGSGLVRSLARPEANITGSSLQALDTNAKELQLFAQAVGRLTSMVSFVPGDVPPAFTAPLINVANALGFRIQFVSYKSSRELEPMVGRLAREVDGVSVADAFLTDTHRRVAALLVQRRLPSIGHAPAGYLLGYEYSDTWSAQVAAKQVDQILRGAMPADLPVEQISTFELGINLRTAKALGLSIPSSVLVQATRLIE